jgi:pimeloyl-ACP methyl ester carboxylesterase
MLTNMPHIHGWTGSSAVWQRNIPALSEKYRVITPDLRGHGASGKPEYGYHVSRLAMDLRALLLHLTEEGGIKWPRFRAIGGSLGCAILWQANDFNHWEALVSH